VAVTTNWGYNMRELTINEFGFVSGGNGSTPPPPPPPPPDPGQGSGSRAGGWRSYAIIFVGEWALGKVVDKVAELVQSAAEPNGAPVEPLPGPYDHWAPKPGG
jgi:hypothetical protein